MVKRRLLYRTLAVLVSGVAWIAASEFARHDVKAERTFSVTSLMLDVEAGLTLAVDSKQWSCPLVCPLEINVATPPRRKLDDIRSYVRLGCVGINVFFAHYRGPAASDARAPRPALRGSRTGSQGRLQDREKEHERL